MLLVVVTKLETPGGLSKAALCRLAAKLQWKEKGRDEQNKRNKQAINTIFRRTKGNEENRGMLTYCPKYRDYFRKETIFQVGAGLSAELLKYLFILRMETSGTLI